jgi:hypothetical protein
MAKGNRQYVSESGVPLPLIIAKTFYDVFDFNKDRDLFWRIIICFWTTDADGIAFKALYDDHLVPFIRRTITQDRVKARLIDLRKEPSKLIDFKADIVVASQIKVGTIISPSLRLKDQLAVFLTVLLRRMTDEENVEKLLRSQEQRRRVIKALSVLVNVKLASALSDVISGMAQFAASIDQAVTVEHIIARIRNKPGAIAIYLVLLGRAVKAKFQDDGGLSKSKLKLAVQTHAFFGEEQFEESLHLLCDEVKIVTIVKEPPRNIYRINREFAEPSRIYFDKLSAAQASFVSSL